MTRLTIDNSANMDYNIRANVLVICVKFHMDMFNNYGEEKVKNYSLYSTIRLGLFYKIVQKSFTPIDIICIIIYNCNVRMELQVY